MSDRRTTPALVLAATGIVFGDIGTSPIYAFGECVRPRHAGEAVARGDVLGALALIVWSLVVVVTVKYVAFMMRADNRGEGGILALLALVPERAWARTRTGLSWVAVLVAAGAALLYGDGVITPAISVLSAVEGVRIAAPRLGPAVVPLTCAILAALFALQPRGTGRVGKLFGPVMAAWFVTIGALGAWHLAHHPDVLAALSPACAARYFAAHGPRGLAILGSVVLAVTGGEALYADMGHFGRGPIRAAWLGLVLPCLVLSYLGQGALVLSDPRAAAAPFFAQVPVGPATWALVALATPATVIASQALIAGVFSLTHQAVQLGYFPRVEVRHTSGAAEGQVFAPAVNAALAVACVALVLLFRHSSRLAAAYGLAVSWTMAITSVTWFVVAREAWRWPLAKALAPLALFLAFDAPFALANSAKFVEGGYVPVLIASVVFAVMVDWRVGVEAFRRRTDARAEDLERLVAELPARLVARTPGAAVFLTTSTRATPPVLARLVAALRVLPEVAVVMHVETVHVPVVARDARLEVRELGHGVWRVLARRGFRERYDVPELVAQAVDEHALPVDPATVCYFVGRDTFVAGPGGRLGRAAEGLFAFLARNAHATARYLGVPPERVIELGGQTDL